MRFRRLISSIAVCAVAVAFSAGCRSGGTSYSVKWARRGEAIAKADTQREKHSKAPPIRQTSANADESVADIDVGDEEAKEQPSRWANLFGKKDKAKRLQLPRTDLIDDDEPAPKDASFGEF